MVNLVAQPSQNISFLDHCIEDLSPKKVADCEKAATRSKILVAISTVAFFALAIGIFIMTSTLAPAYLPITGISALLSAIFYAVPKIGELYNRAQDDLKRANNYRETQRHYADLTAKTPQQLQQILLQMGIAWDRIPGIQVQHPEQLVRLNPLLAQAKFLEDQTSKYAQLKEESAREAQQFQVTQPRDIQKKFNLCRLALSCEHTIVILKLRSALINAALRKPDLSKRSIEQLVTVSKLNCIEQLLGDALNDPAAKQFLTFSNRNIAPITFDEAKRLSVPALGQRIFSAAP